MADIHTISAPDSHGCSPNERPIALEEDSKLADGPGISDAGSRRFHARPLGAEARARDREGQEVAVALEITPNFSFAVCLVCFDESNANVACLSVSKETRLWRGRGFHGERRKEKSFEMENVESEILEGCAQSQQRARAGQLGTKTKTMSSRLAMAVNQGIA
jgi:hypothetical protein